jgi:fibronectin type 3 domain-containing protein
MEGQPEATLVGTVSGSEFIDTGATVGRPHTYAVQAVAGTSESVRSLPASVVPRDIFPPPAPTALTAVAGIGSIELTWDRTTAADFRAYRVYRATGRGEFTLLSDAVQGPAYSDRQITTGMEYRFRVTAVDQAGNESEPSTPLEVTAP